MPLCCRRHLLGCSTHLCPAAHQFSEIAIVVEGSEFHFVMICQCKKCAGLNRLHKVKLDYDRGELMNAGLSPKDYNIRQMVVCNKNLVSRHALISVGDSYASLVRGPRNGGRAVGAGLTLGAAGAGGCNTLFKHRPALSQGPLLETAIQQQRVCPGLSKQDPAIGGRSMTASGIVPAPTRFDNCQPPLLPPRDRSLVDCLFLKRRPAAGGEVLPSGFEVQTASTV